jgi:hypothetical protein
MQLSRGPDRAIPLTRRGGHLLAEVMDDRLRTHYQFFRSPDGGVVLRFHGLADFVGDDRLTDVVVHVDPTADPDLVQVLTGGALIATRLILDGRLVLHASALQIGLGALAFVGMSGMGKSTMAALGLAAGYTPITDDVLRVELGTDGGTQVWPGSRELRLRETARSIADRSGRPLRTTADGRTAVSIGASGVETVSLHCCVVPFPDREIVRPSVQLLDPFTALQRLLAFPRIVGWCDPTTAAQQFEHLATLCERTPVIEARLPWGPPFSDQLVDELIDRIDAELGTALRGEVA